MIRLRPLGSALTFLLLTQAALATEDAVYLGDAESGIAITHQQAWGDFGFNRAAARTGATGSPLQVGKVTFDRGLGHHASGEIVVNLRGQYALFRTGMGVQWQGGNRGSVIFRIIVDGKTRFEAGPLSDSDPLQRVEIPLQGARELRLVASDAGDGIACDMANWIEAQLVRDPDQPFFGDLQIELGDRTEPPAVTSVTGFTLIAGQSGPQAAVMEPGGFVAASVKRGERVGCIVPAHNLTQPLQIAVDVFVLGTGATEIELSLDDQSVSRVLQAGDCARLRTPPTALSSVSDFRMTARGVDGDACVRWGGLRYEIDGDSFAIPLTPPRADHAIPPPVMPLARPSMEQAIIEWDWRMQDGIGTTRQSRTWRDATSLTIERGDRLIEHLRQADVDLVPLLARWNANRAELQKLIESAEGTTQSQWESLWRDVHQRRREIALRNPLAQTGPIAFVKRVPSAFSHQLTQYAGWRARPGGGVFVLDDPGKSMKTRRLDSLPEGSYMHLDVSWDGQRLLFAHCETIPHAASWMDNREQFYQVYEVDVDGSHLRSVTDGPFDHFAPRYLPNGKVLMISTRRGGFHRCGRGPCPVYTMALVDRIGAEPRVISFHETHEWDPAVLNDGRVIYTRWDYVDRHAVHYQQLWTIRPDGSDVRAFYGNNTLNPVGVWEARAVPGSDRVMATAAAHHAMTAGSIILLDVHRGIDGLEPIERLTPDVLFPESEFPIQRWHAKAGVPAAPKVPTEELRWPGHSYRSPFPLSEDFFLAAYSFEPLLGEPLANAPNMFGLYLVDRFGNKELLYRDPAVSSLWPMPLRPRPISPSLPSSLADETADGGAFLLQDVYASWPRLPRDEVEVKSLRILQVLPKTTPHSNTPRVGAANASPGKQVLGTVPVEADGSAYFRAPAGIPLAFQALDEHGMAIQTMRSLTNLQPGEQAACIGCHEHRTTAPAVGRPTLASCREPSVIQPGPEGSKPFSYPVLVQPILDRHCVSCHGGEKTEANLDLTAKPAGSFTRSYNAMVALVPFSEWKSTPQANHEPMTHPNQFGARASPLMQLLQAGHEGVVLNEAEFERLITWMDTNALFYGTFDPDGQARQLRGELIAGPALE